MKKLISLLCAGVLVVMIGCGSDKVVNGKECKTIGLVNILANDSSIMETKRQDVQYRVIWGNIIWGGVLIGTVIAPVYFWGFSMFEPVGPKVEVK